MSAKSGIGARRQQPPLGAGSDSDEDLDDKKRDRRDKKRMLALKKKARELADAAFAEASKLPVAESA